MMQQQQPWAVGGGAGQFPGQVPPASNAWNQASTAWLNQGSAAGPTADYGMGSGAPWQAVPAPGQAAAEGFPSLLGGQGNLGFNARSKPFTLFG